MNIRQRVLEKVLALTAAAGLLTAGLCGCSGGDGGIQGSCITVSKEGAIEDCIRESFDKDYYDQNELQNEVLQAVSNYNNRIGEERITVEKVQIDGDVTDVRMGFHTDADYADFNREVFFIGTPLEAQAAGYDLNHVFVSTEDVSRTMGEAELLATTGIRVLITNTDQSVTLYNKIQYVSDKVELKNKNRTFRIVKEENEQISKEVCVIFKE